MKIKNVKFSKNIAQVEVNYKTTMPLIGMVQLTNPQDCENVFRSIWSDKIEYIEQMYVLVLNRANANIGWFELAKGGLSFIAIDVRVLFQAALVCNAHNIVIAHNHPSGNAVPSLADIDMTKNVVAAGKVLDINVLDHLIITKNNCFKFSENGLI